MSLRQDLFTTGFGCGDSTECEMSTIIQGVDDQKAAMEEQPLSIEPFAPAVAAQRDSVCHFDELPDELILAIFGHVDVVWSREHTYSTRRVILRVCRRFRRLMLDASLWRSPVTSWWHNHYSCSSFLDTGDGIHLLCDVRDALLLLHAAWPDPSAPPPPLRLALKMAPGDGALLDRAAALGLGAEMERLGQIVEYGWLEGIEDESELASLWKLLQGPALRLVWFERCSFSAPPAINLVPGLEDLRIDDVRSEGTCLGYLFDRAPALERLTLSFAPSVSLLDSVEIPAAYSGATCNLRCLFLGDMMEISPQVFPQLEYLTTLAAHPQDLGWELEGPLPPKLREVAFLFAYDNDRKSWCLPFLEANQQVDALVTVGFVEHHQNTSFAHIALPARPAEGGPRTSVVTPLDTIDSAAGARKLLISRLSDDGLMYYHFMRA